VSNNRCFAAVVSASVDSVNFVLGGLSFLGENPKSDLRWLYLAMTAS
jgi:hypothetical protein